ncbi:PaaI family thioesterase [Bacillus sp. JCM 19041]|uniref:PaaI family thioesterase n=1 Tax=Bacillus sp. JCM 19041 TaxID=1460637 RepID=UPI0006D20C3E
MNEKHPVFEKKQSPFFELLGFENRVDDRGNVYIELEVKEEHLNIQGLLHGGVHAAMIDNILGTTLFQATETPSVTTSLHIHYFTPFNEGKLTARAKIQNLTYKSAMVEASIYTEEGTVVAKGSGTFKLMRKAGKDI